MINYKAIDFERWGGIDGYLQATGGGMVERASLLRSVVPWAAKAHDLTKSAVANLPFEIVRDDGSVIDTSTDWQNIAGGMPNPQRMLSLIAGSLCGGSAYLLKQASTRMVLSLQYVAPHNVIPHLNDNGVDYFERVLGNGKRERVSPDDMVYFWLPDSDVEIGVPLTTPASTSLPAVELLAANSSTLKIQADRGWVPAYIGSAESFPSKEEKEKAERYLFQFLRGAYHSAVRIINSNKLNLQRVGAGLDELKGVYSEITRQAIEDVGAAYGIPAALFMSDKSFASEVKPLIKEWYTSSVFVSIWKTIEETFNEQVYAPYNLRMQFKPESLPVFQEDENQRASAVGAYTSAINQDPEVAKWVMSVLGVDLDQEQEDELEEIINSRVKEEETTTEPETQDQKDEPPMQEAEDTEDVSLSPDETKDLALWYSKAKAWNLKGKGNAVDWENKHLREEIAAPIRLKLADAKNELDIVKAFEVGRPRRIAKVVQDDSAIKSLADSINRAVETATKAEYIQPAPTFNMTMPAINLTATMPPSGTVTVNVPEQAAPIVNVTTPETVVNVASANPPVNNITVQPADVVLPAMPTEATIIDSKGNKKTLKVNK